LTRDGIHLAELRRIGREQLDRYEIEYRTVRVTDARCASGGFELALEDGGHEACRSLLLATGVQDRIPEI
jgi:thioredoxin reductase